MSQLAKRSSSQAQAHAEAGLRYETALEIEHRGLEQWTRDIFEYGRELSLFTLARFNQNLGTWRALGNRNNVGEVFHCQCDSAQKETTAHLAEAGKLLQLTMADRDG
ncbi:MAG TPA: hypothetical protein VN823_13015 [Stellaceae bacterium]|nr:hypothetical protein [Stellaceae bacterium]